MPGMPAMETIAFWMQGADAEQMYSQSPLMAQHTRAGSFERRFAIVMNENFRLMGDFERYVCVGYGRGLSADELTQIAAMYSPRNSCSLRLLVLRIGRGVASGEGGDVNSYVPCLLVDAHDTYRTITTVRWCAGLANKRLLAGGLLGHSGLLCEFCASFVSSRLVSEDGI